MKRDVKDLIAGCREMFEEHNLSVNKLVAMGYSWEDLDNKLPPNMFHINNIAQLPDGVTEYDFDEYEELEGKDIRPIIAKQILKYQYPIRSVVNKKAFFFGDDECDQVLIEGVQGPVIIIYSDYRIARHNNWSDFEEREPAYARAIMVWLEEERK
jgi:hypothetical protein